MTLQQKMLAKQSKKGFTLVELVVVIAILAILAAIAIPAVIGIINSATKSAGASDASTLNNACKTVYAGVKSGSITSQSKDNAGTNCTWAAAPGASNSDRLKAAKSNDCYRFRHITAHHFLMMTFTMQVQTMMMYTSQRVQSYSGMVQVQAHWCRCEAHR